MDEYESLSHTRWDCKYHVVFIPKCRRKAQAGSSNPKPIVGPIVGPKRFLKKYQYISVCYEGYWRSPLPPVQGFMVVLACAWVAFARGRRTAYPPR